MSRDSWTSAMPGDIWILALPEGEAPYLRTQHSAFIPLHIGRSDHFKIHDEALRALEIKTGRRIWPPAPATNPALFEAPTEPMFGTWDELDIPSEIHPQILTSYLDYADCAASGDSHLAGAAYAVFLHQLALSDREQRLWRDLDGNPGWVVRESMSTPRDEVVIVECQRTGESWRVDEAEVHRLRRNRTRVMPRDGMGLALDVANRYYEGSRPFRR